MYVWMYVCILVSKDARVWTRQLGGALVGNGVWLVGYETTDDDGFPIRPKTMMIGNQYCRSRV